ncbi:MAG: hypothetical protein KDA85_10735, partial [Planctomycetaceae bacterium]|nr:hypothetical protein [Planctomycetaceae bacterium]
AFLQTLSAPIRSIAALGEWIGGTSFREGFPLEPWNNGAEFALPSAVTSPEVTAASSRLSDLFERTGIRLLSVRSRIMFPAEFNQQTAEAGSKGVVLSRNTMALVREACDSHPGHNQIHVTCDKHGGRNRYDELLAEAFDDALVFRIRESLAASHYRMGNSSFVFRMKAEEVLPVAVASMVAKYLREVLMEQFNQFWQNQVPNLKPTKGYPVDAKRFAQEIQPAMEQLGIARERIWRSR